LAKQCPLLALNSSAISLSQAISASSIVIRPGCAKISTSGQLTALRFVPSMTGSAKVSPCTIIISAPNFRARLASLQITCVGVCVISTPGTTTMSQLS